MLELVFIHDPFHLPSHFSGQETNFTTHFTLVPFQNHSGPHKGHLTLSPPPYASLWTSIPHGMGCFLTLSLFRASLFIVFYQGENKVMKVAWNQVPQSLWYLFGGETLTQSDSRIDSMKKKQEWDCTASGKVSAYQCRGHWFNPWSGKIPHAAGQLSVCHDCWARVP